MIRVSRIAIIYWSLVLFAAALILRSGELQLWQGAEWASRADRQHVSSSAIPAPRGRILDAAGVVLAESRELVRFSVAPREVRDRRALARALAAAGVSPRWVMRATDMSRAWVEIPGSFPRGDVAAMTVMSGVYPEPVIERVYAPSPGMRRLVGRASGSRAVDGFELGLDSLLRGLHGVATRLRDARGRSFESPVTSRGAIAAREGHTVTLTLSYRLQEIADRALATAVAKMGATGGDIVVVDPFTGAVLAMASHRAAGVSAATALTEPFEPGSTLKPLVAASLLSLRRARADEVIETYDGVYRTADRTITDLHKARALSLRDVIRWSSNVGIVRFTERLTPAEQYQSMRDFGFGISTGSPYPSESPGTLHAPRTWSRVSSASLAMGYEIAVTPLQLAMAYASIANGGELLEPAFIREVRSSTGDVHYRQRKRVVRRVMSPEVAAEVREMLLAVVEGGTAMEADLSTFLVGGKTGTSRTSLVGQRGYALRQYFATFVGLFPADAPQYVVLVKLDRPADRFGGVTAAPVTRAVLEAALAARDAALDRNALASRTTERRRPAPPSAPVPLRAQREDPSGTVPVVFSLAGDDEANPAGAPRLRPVPDVRGLTLREAVHALHRAGFRVELTPGGAAETAPAAGSFHAPGAIVRLGRER
ncbi:MAG TPA: penicillin-binding transpeptidase domain-containing protein [Gemmatimonadaceae bacterium]|nr:penicillin-binding transpeptidase domain-containing protein [Gemmatimonadaceae bacterium]